MILAIDTTSDSASIALVEGTGVIEEVLLESPDGFAHVLFGEIEAAAGASPMIAMDQIDGLRGRQSRTRIVHRRSRRADRYCQGATWPKPPGRKRGGSAISNLQALASFGSYTIRAVVIDARRGDIYGAVYDAALNPVREELVIKYDDWLANPLPAGDLERDLEFELEFITTSFPITGVGNALVTQAPRAVAGAIGKIAASRFAAGLAQDPSMIDANYVRRSDAEVFWKDVCLPLAPRE